MNRRDLLRFVAAAALAPAAGALAACDPVSLVADMNAGPQFMEFFLRDLRTGKADQAYARTTERFRKNMTLAEFEAVVRENGLKETAAVSWPNQSYSSTWNPWGGSTEIQLSGTVRLSAGKRKIGVTLQQKSRGPLQLDSWTLGPSTVA